ncbi:4-alpha-glucanotransferase [bacterium]|nr:4-alpha-glucanotransferase [bacterium]
MIFKRAFGILFHPTALPGKYGIGDTGVQALELLDIIKSMGGSLWQFLPLHPTTLGNSPYSAGSAFAGNPLLISPDDLVRQEFLTISDCKPPTCPTNRVDYDSVAKFKETILRKAFAKFSDRNGRSDAKYNEFIKHHEFWLKDYALFQVLKTENKMRPWYQWPTKLKFRNIETLQQLTDQKQYEIHYQYFLQYLFFTQWSCLKNEAANRDIQLIGDMPLFVALDSAEVWSHTEYFQLDSTLKPVNVAGVPPDYFSSTGQLWGNPLYDWTRLKENNYSWWLKRFKTLLELVDIVRIDHFRGFEKYWSVPVDESTAENGHWVEGPGFEFFNVLKNSLGNLPVIAEDLGIITPEVENLRDSFNFPGMKILQFAFGSDEKNPYLPHNHTTNSVVYSGTHDNDTTLGWWNTMNSDQREKIVRRMEIIQGHQVLQPLNDIIRMCLGSTSTWSILPIQDILALESDARFNTPGTASGNWEWRLENFHSLIDQTTFLREQVMAFDRINLRSD